MRITLFFLSFLLLGVVKYDAQRPFCLGASQNRMYPLGQTAQGLAVVETHWYRTEYSENENEADEFDTGWGGTVFFKIYNEDHHAVHTEIIDKLKLFREDLYLAKAADAFDKGMKKASALPGFVAAKPLSIVFGEYGNKCGRSKIVIDTLQDRIALRTSGRDYPVKILHDSTSIAANMVSFYKNTDGISISSNLYDNLGISSIRQFSVDSKKLTVFHLGNGSGMFDKQRKHKANFAFADIDKSTYIEPVLHHGTSFDFFIWN